MNTFFFFNWTFDIYTGLCVWQMIHWSYMMDGRDCISDYEYRLIHLSQGDFASWNLGKVIAYQMSHRRKYIEDTNIALTSLRKMQWTITMTNPCNESNTANSIWNSIDLLSVIARTADIHVKARRGRTTQELQRDALCRERYLFAEPDCALCMQIILRKFK